MNRSPIKGTVGDAKMTKVKQLQSSNPETFGNTTGAHHNKYATDFDHQEFNKERQAVNAEN